MRLNRRSQDVAEIAGCSERVARNLVRGDEWPDEARLALERIDGDIDQIVDLLVEMNEGKKEAILFVFQKKRQLRTNFPHWPARGHANGGFNGPHAVAVLSARETLLAKGIDVKVAFFNQPAT